MWELCTALFLTELIHHVTKGEEKKCELCTALFLTELIHHVTQGEEKKWELCTALFLTELIHHVTQEEEKKWELCTALFLAYQASLAEYNLDFSLLHHGGDMVYVENYATNKP